MPPEPTATEEGHNLGVPKSFAKDLHLQHHYETRRDVKSIIMESESRINAKKLERMVKFHASQIPNADQVNRVWKVLEQKREEFLAELLKQNNKRTAGVEEFEEATCRACIVAEALIQLIMDDDLSIRETSTVGIL